MRALLLLGLLATFGCNGSDPLEVRVYTLEVTREDDGISSLDVEVHIFDEVSGEHVACSGNDQGLEEVDQSDINYRLNAFFRSVPRGTRLTLDMVEGRSLIFEVWEDDSQPCPMPPDPAVGDDPIGTSGPLEGGNLDIGVLTFENVNELELGYQ